MPACVEKSDRVKGAGAEQEMSGKTGTYNTRHTKSHIITPLPSHHSYALHLPIPTANLHTPLDTRKSTVKKHAIHSLSS